MPEALRYRSKNALALELIDEALGRGLPRAAVLADGDYGDDFAWRAALRQRDVTSCVAVEPRKAWTQAPVAAAAGHRAVRPKGPAARPAAP